MHNTPISEQPKVVIFGLRNAGKSSLMNNIFGKEVSIVSDFAGTTTDPVTKPIELGKLGSVAMVDTAGFDDEGILGELRVRKTANKLEVADIPLLVTRGDIKWDNKELEILEKFKGKNLFVVITFADKKLLPEKLNINFPYQIINNITAEGISELKDRLIKLFENYKFEITPVEGIVNENDFVLLVTPIDLAAPKGRLILPQVETIRDLLDKDCGVMIVKERELKYFYENLGIKPKLVITDSQVFNKVASDIDENQLLTSFSILFARKKGDLSYLVEGTKSLKNISGKAKVLILEACSHHKQADDIGSVKIPRLFKQMVESNVEFHFAKDIEKEKLKEFDIVITCGGCMVTRNEMEQRLTIMKDNDIKVTNYGLFLAWAHGLLPRALEPFPHEYNLWIND